VNDEEVEMKDEKAKIEEKEATSNKEERRTHRGESFPQDVCST
jgi:hypothetical protein